MRIKGCNAQPDQGRRVKRGFTEEETRKVIGHNFLRVYRKVIG